VTSCREILIRVTVPVEAGRSQHGKNYDDPSKDILHQFGEVNGSESLKLKERI
jgi:hypothetical protein